jgi:hypothetical protein
MTTQDKIAEKFQSGKVHDSLPMGVSDESLVQEL